MLAIILAVATALAASNAAHGETLAGETMHSIGSGGLRNDWRFGRRAEPGETHELLWAVRQRNVENGVLTRTLMEVSDPASPRYGKFLSSEDISALVSNPQATGAVVTFLEKLGANVTAVTKHGEYLRATAPVSVWEQVLGTEFHHYHFVDMPGQVAPSKRDIIRTPVYHIPRDIAEHVEFVGWATQLPPRKPESMVPQRISDAEIIANLTQYGGASGQTTPSLLNSFYEISTNKGSAKVSQALFESLGQNYSPSDLASFQSQFDLPPEKISKDIGGHASGTACASNPNNCAEANLDVQYMMAISQTTPTTFWYISNEDTPFLSWIEAVAAADKPPLVHSMSYGSIESEVEKSVLKSFNTEAQKLGAQGISIFVSSGDDGVANFGARSSSSACGFNPSFPATSPYVTAVGATMGPETSTTEIACQSNKGGLITTGGGFSTYYSQPSYQANAVEEYFSVAKKPQGTGYKKTNRGYPDVAMLGHNYVVAINGAFYQVSGTSCAAPVTAAMASLVNAARIKAGKSSLGFINPSIYGNKGKSCNDITSGENNCCAGSGGSEVCCKDGFFAAKGWDPLTGWGSVDFQRFAQEF